MDAQDFIINVGPNGTFRPSGSYQTLPKQVDTIFERFETESIKKIAIYFHGGLVNEKTGMKTAIKMEKHISDAGFTPLCFVWETGLMETVSTNIRKITETKIFNKLIKVLIKKLSQKLGFDLVHGRGVGNLLTDEEIETELFKSAPFKTYDQKKLKVAGRGDEAIEMLPNNEADLIQSLEAEFTFLIEPDYEFVQIIAETKLTVNKTNTVQSRGIITTAKFIKHVAIIAFRVIKRFINKRDHDFYPSIVEEILRELNIAELGAWVWNNMKVKSNDMWNDNQDKYRLNRFAGRYVLDKLLAYKKRHNDVEINLIGHSAGSIAICNLLKVTAEIDSSFSYNKVVFMAPACRIDLFHAEMVSHQNRFKQFRMFTMSDDYETKDCLVKYFYTHSLLYLISGVLEGEGEEFDCYVLGLERHIDGREPYHEDNMLKETSAFIFKNDSNRIAFSKTDATDPDGMRTTSTSHGGFDDDKPTIDSIKHFLKEA
jgi:hypothetical protein